MMVETSKDFDELWKIRLKPMEDMKRIETWYKYDDIVFNGTNPNVIAAAYQKYRERYTGIREQYAKRMLAWLDDMDENGGFNEVSETAAKKYPTGLAYETGPDGLPIQGSFLRFNPIMKRWIKISEEEQAEKHQMLCNIIDKRAS